MNSNETQKFINFWDFLELPMNSSIVDIKLAYQKKFIEIEESLYNKEVTYTANDLIIANQAYEVLSNPSKRFWHNCEIDGEDPDDIFDCELIYEAKEDLSPDDNEMLVKWLRSKINDYMDMYKDYFRSINDVVWEIPETVFKDIIFGLVQNYTQLQSSLQKGPRIEKKLDN